MAVGAAVAGAMVGAEAAADAEPELADAAGLAAGDAEVMTAAVPALWFAANRPKAATVPTPVAATDLVTQRRRRNARSRRRVASVRPAGSLVSLLMASCWVRQVGAG